jgi:hypothetical protein
MGFQIQAGRENRGTSRLRIRANKLPKNEYRLVVIHAPLFSGPALYGWIQREMMG